MKKHLKKFTAALLAMTLAVSFLSGCVKTKQTSVENTEHETVSVITTGGTPWIDSDLKENITADMNLSPKNDFHLYVNHDWLMRNDIEAGKRSISSFSEVENDVIKKIKALLTDTSLTSHDAKLAQTLYNLCMDRDKRNEQGMEPVKPLINDIQSISTIDGLTDFISNPDKSLGINFVDFYNQEDLNDSNFYALWVGSYKTLLEDAAEYKSRTEVGTRCYEAKKEAAATLLKRIGYENGEALFDRVIDFETTLSDGQLTVADQMSSDFFEKINNVMTIRELAQICPNFPLEKVMSGYGFKNAKKIIVYEPEYFRLLDGIYNEKNLEDMKAFMLVRYILNTAEDLDKEAHDIYIKMQNTINGSSGELSDEEEACRAVRTCLTETLAKLYVTEYHMEKTRDDITNICRKVIEYYRNMLRQTDWLSPETREKAITKLDNIKINAVYPDKWTDNSSLSLDGLSYFEALDAIYKFKFYDNRRKTDQKVDNECWAAHIGMSLLEINALYNPLANSIIILPGILDGEFYREDMTIDELYGGIGSVIGHEISHAFDTSGAQFDEKGTLVNWWTDEDLKKFNERADKLVNYIDSIVTYDGKNAVGEATKTETIADMTSVKCILGMADEQENFDYDKFFCQYTKVWRRINTYEVEEICRTKDSHPLHYLRTNATLQQFDKFFETYDIKEGDNMYLSPENRVLVW